MLHPGPDLPLLLGIKTVSAQPDALAESDAIRRQAVPVCVMSNRQDERQQIAIVRSRLSLLTAEGCALAQHHQPMTLDPSSCRGCVP